jgi:hypothetical protein
MAIAFHRVAIGVLVCRHPEVTAETGANPQNVAVVRERVVVRLGRSGGITRNGDASAPAMVIACPLGHGRKPVAASIPLRGPAEWSTRKQPRGVPT